MKIPTSRCLFQSINRFSKFAYFPSIFRIDIGGIAQPMRLMGLMWRPRDLFVNIAPTRGPGPNCHPPPLLYIACPRGQMGTLSPLMMSTLSLEWFWFWVSLVPSFSLCWLAESPPQQFGAHRGFGTKLKLTSTSLQFLPFIEFEGASDSAARLHWFGS